MMRNSWLLWAGASAVFAAVTAILAKLGVEGVNSNLATAVRTAVVLIFAWAFVFATGSGGGLRALNARTWWFLTLSGAATGLSWLCYFRALQLGQASQVAPIDKLSVVLTLVLAALFLGEKLTWHEWLGGALIAAGAVVIALRPS